MAPRWTTLEPVAAHASPSAGGCPPRSTTQPVLEALQQALWQRNPLGSKSLIHRSERRAQDLPIRCAERLAAADVDPVVGTAGASHDNALAGSVIGRCETHVIKQLAPRKDLRAVERETMPWVDWHNIERLHSAVGDILPAEVEPRHRDPPDTVAMLA